MAAYLQTFSLWGRTANAVVELPYSWGTTRGVLEDTPARRDFSGLGDLGVTLSFNLKEGVALSQAVDAVQKVAREILPATIVTNFQGAAQAFQSSLQGLWILLLMAILVIYLILGILYESFIHPLTILSGLPSAGFGALVTLMLFGMDLNIYAFVGVIMLVGIVKKNAIMMIDFALEVNADSIEFTVVDTKPGYTDYLLLNE